MDIGLLSIYITLGFVFLGIYKHDSKVITCILMLLLFILFSYEHTEGDYAVYVRVYDDIGAYLNASNYEPLYVLSCRFFNQLNFTFDQMRAVFSFVEIISFYYVIRKYTKNTALVFAFFIVYPATLFAELFRSLVGTTIIIWGLHYLLTDNSKRRKWLYLASVILASMFHTSCWIFLIYYLLVVQSRKQLIWILLFGILIGIIIIQNDAFFNLFSLFAESERLIEKYGSNVGHNMIGILSELFRLAVVFSICICTVGWKNVNKWFHVTGVKVNTKQSIANTLQYRTIDLNLISILLFIPLYYSSLNDRLLLPLLFYNYVALGSSLNKEGAFKKVYGLIACVVLLLMKLFIKGEWTQLAFISHFTEGYMIRMVEELFGH